MLQRAWDFCGEVRVNFCLLLLISLNLGIGSYYLKFNGALFDPLNHLLIQEWVQTMGRQNPGQTWWLASLLLLLFFLGVNTLVCALKRLIQLWPFRRQIGLRSFTIRVSPSFIHLCFLAILGGHLISLIVGFHGVIPAKPGSAADLPEGLKSRSSAGAVNAASFPVHCRERSNSARPFCSSRTPVVWRSGNSGSWNRSLWGKGPFTWTWRGGAPRVRNSRSSSRKTPAGPSSLGGSPC